MGETIGVDGYLTYRRWRLRDGVDIADVVDIVQRRIIPHYRRLDPAVRLGLESVDGSRAVLAVQRWPDRCHHRRATSGPDFDSWFERYRPILHDWDRLVEFEAEWETVRLI